MSEVKQTNYYLGRKPDPQTFAIGDRVGYTRYFMKQICTPPTDPMWSRAGSVVAIEEPFVRVKWDDEPETPGLVHAGNIARVGTAAWAD